MNEKCLNMEDYYFIDVINKNKGVERWNTKEKNYNEAIIK